MRQISIDPTHMKKKLEAELISLAHRILQLKNKSDIAVLHLEAQKLYEKLSVLRFVEENFAGQTPTIGRQEAEEKLEKAFDYNEKVIVAELPEIREDEEIQTENQTDSPESSETLQAETELPGSGTDSEWPDEPKVEASSEENPDFEASQDETDEETGKEPAQVSESQLDESPTIESGAEFESPETVEEVAHANTDEKPIQEFENAHVDLIFEPKEPQAAKEEKPFKPDFELSFDPKEETSVADTPAPQFTFDDLLGKDYADPVFVKPDEVQKPETPSPSVEKPTDIFDRRPFESAKPETEKSSSLNERLSKGITIGLNDRVAFMKNLFNNSSEDYNRVLSQLITFDTFGEAKEFIEQMVKPDYNNWYGKEEYEQRFMEIVEKRFS